MAPLVLFPGPHLLSVGQMLPWTRTECTASPRMDFLVVWLLLTSKRQERVPLETSAPQNFRKMAEKFWVRSQLEGGPSHFHRLSEQHKVLSPAPPQLPAWLS